MITTVNLKLIPSGAEAAKSEELTTRPVRLDPPHSRLTMAVIGPLPRRIVKEREPDLVGGSQTVDEIGDQEAIVQTLARIMDLCDIDTSGHSVRVTQLMIKVAESTGMNQTEIQHARWGAMLHDLGKIGVPPDILSKCEPLDREEWQLIRKHPDIARDILAPIPFLRSAITIPYCHHEKWDGSGYPCGLKGDEIPSSARLFAVIDVWDALTSDRPYRSAWPAASALEYLRQQAGFQFDPWAVQVVLPIIMASRSGL